jgi:hypothetical protein
MSERNVVVSAEVVSTTIEHFTALDQAGDKGAMTQLARRLGKEQPALLSHAARLKEEHGDALGEAAIFYGTLVWAIFDRAFGKRLTRLIPQNLADASEVVDRDAAPAEGAEADERPVWERPAPGVTERQPHILAKLVELFAEDVKEGAIPAEGAAIIFRMAEVVVEAFDAASAGRRPGQALGPIVREEPKVGRNDPCPCGSGKKWKRCHGAEAA